MVALNLLSSLTVCPASKEVSRGAHASRRPWLRVCLSLARDDDGFRNGHAYIPLTPDQAQRWLELRGLDEELDALFGEGLEDA